MERTTVDCEFDDQIYDASPESIFGSYDPCNRSPAAPRKPVFTYSCIGYNGSDDMSEISPLDLDETDEDEDGFDDRVPERGSPLFKRTRSPVEFDLRKKFKGSPEPLEF